MTEWWEKKLKDDPSDIHPSGPIPREDCLNAANNLIADLTRKNQELQDRLEAQKRKANSFETTLVETEEKLEKTSELVRNAEKEVDELKEQKSQSRPQKATWFTPYIFSTVTVLILFIIGFLQSRETEELKNKLVLVTYTSKEALIADLVKSKAEAEKVSDENKKLSGEIEELKKKITPPEPVEEKRGTEVKYKKLQWYHYISGVLLGLVCALLFICVSSALMIWLTEGYQLVDFANWVIVLIFAIGSGIGAYSCFKSTPQDETVQVEQIHKTSTSTYVELFPDTRNRITYKR